jgi:hypothetical protein
MSLIKNLMITILYGGLFTGDPVWAEPRWRTTIYGMQDVVCVALTGMRCLTQCGTNAIKDEYKINPLIRIGEILCNIGLFVLLTNLPASLVGFSVGFISTLIVGLVFDVLEKWQYCRYAKEECIISVLGILLRQAPTSLGEDYLCLYLVWQCFVL